MILVAGDFLVVVFVPCFFYAAKAESAGESKGTILSRHGC